MDKIRRRLLVDSARTAGGVALCGLALAMYARKSTSLPTQALRPPGAIGDREFLSACVRCGLLFGMGTGWIVILGIFLLDLLDLLVSRRGWCGHLCPVGAFYSVLGNASVLRVSAARREQCNQCMDCIQVCPESQVFKLPLFGAEKGAGPIILSPNCTNCGRCIDICSRDVFQFGTRFGCRTEHRLQFAKEAQR